MIKILKRVLFTCSILLFSMSYVYGEEIKAIECEYTEQYKKWLRMTDEEKNGLSVPVMCKTDDTFFKLVGDTNVMASFTSAKFDLRDYNYVTSVKNQNKSETCWAFATMASIESNLLMNNKGNYDFSEAHLELATQNSLFESLMPFSREFNSGGNYFMSAAYLFNRVGPVLESDAPFSLVDSTIANSRTATLVDISNKKVQFSVEDSTFISADQGKCSNDSINSIKKYLVSNGAISADMYFESSTTNMKLDGTKIIDDFINGPYYYYDGSSYKRQLSYSSIEIAKNKSSNHGITIIGWDDTIEASNFSKTPSRNGAWIIKNSYGETLKTTSGDIDMGDKGYYYVSYDDINICTQLSGFYDISSELEDNSYYYDKLGLIGAINVKNSDLYLANIFEKKSSFSEKLKKVTFFSGSIDQKYDIYFSDDGNLKNITKIYSGVSDKIGYTTIGIDDVTIANKKYAIAVKFYGNVSNNIYVYAKQSKIYTMDVPNNVSYMSYDGVNWENFGTTDDNYLSSIRSYTNNLNYTFSLESSSIIDDSLGLSVN